MNQIKKILPVLLATIWISLSEFVRNQVLFNYMWVEHYRAMGLTFPGAPVNGAVWGVWSLVFAIAVYVIAKRFSLLETTLLAWVVAFVMMWLVIGNMGVLPYALLPYAIPLSLLESFGAAFIIKFFYERIKL